MIKIIKKHEHRFEQVGVGNSGDMFFQCKCGQVRVNMGEDFFNDGDIL